MSGLRWGDDLDRDCREMRRLESWGIYPHGHHDLNCDLHGEHEHAAPRPDEVTDCAVCARLGYAVWGASNYATTPPPNPSTSEGESS